MKQHRRNKIYLLLVVYLLSITYCSLPPYIHKLPLYLTDNYVYYADLYFGTQRQNISLLVDTGSRTLAAFCTLCIRGCKANQEFKIQNSPTFSNITCQAINQIMNESVSSSALNLCKSRCRVLSPNDTSQCKGQLTYGSSSLSSFLDYLLIRDFISVNDGGMQVNSSFGCIYDERNFDTGIWGLALSPDNQVLDAIYNADYARGYEDAKKIFTICTQGKQAVMNIGGIDTSYHIGEGVTMNVNPYYYLWWNIQKQDLGAITFQDTIIRSQTQSFGSYGMILDSGTDFIILPAIITNRIADIALSACNEIAGCTLLDPYEIFGIVLGLENPKEYFDGKIITFTIGGKQLETPLSNYFWNLGDGSWALAVVSAQAFNFEISILGSIWMNNFDIAFSRQDNTITIFDITGCEASSRRLQTDDSNDYDFPKVRGDRMDGADTINKLKMKHQRGIMKMLSEANEL